MPYPTVLPDGLCRCATLATSKSTLTLGSAGLVLGLRSPGSAQACCLVAGGGHLYCGRGPEVPESAVPHHRSAGPSVRRGYVPEPCWVMTVGRAGAGCRPRGYGAGKPEGRAVSDTAPIPVVHGQAFSCPWLCGTRGARTRSGRRRPGTAPHSAYPLVSGVLLGEKESGL